MCNCLHADSEPILSFGIGWKLIFLNNKGLPVSVVDGVVYTGEKIVWNPKRDPDGDGFCFFLTKKEADRVNNLHEWGGRSGVGSQRVVKIKYRLGLGKHIETHFIGGETIRIALCKEFEFVDLPKEESKI
jgi:hypothetical protein